MQTNLKNINGNWNSGYVLDKHTVSSVPIGHNEFGYMQFNTTRTEIGEALFLLKNRNDWEQVEPLADELKRTAFPLFLGVGLIVPVPPSQARQRQPVFEIASALARKTGLTSFENILQKAPAKAGAQQLKNLNTKTAKVAALAGRLSINDRINGEGTWNVLVIDDIYDTGASMEAVCGVLQTYNKIGKIYVAALTWR